MAINKYYTQEFEVFHKSRVSSKTGVAETLASKGTFMGILDKATTAYGFTGSRETFEFTDVLYTSPNSNIIEDAIIRFGTISYDVVSVIDPLHRVHHLEILLNRRQ